MIDVAEQAGMLGGRVTEAIIIDRRSAPVAYRVSIDRRDELAGVVRARGNVEAWFAALAGACGDA